jgi:AP2-associated kinase
MHQQGICHRDIKIENILVCLIDSKPVFKIGDFGSATKDWFVDYKTMDKNHIFEKVEEFESCTTLMYRPPEMIDRYAGFQVTLQSDVWMMGCLL